MSIRFFGRKWQASVVKKERIVFFDGDCLLCQASLKWLNRLDARDRLLFAPLQGTLAKEKEIDQSIDSMAYLEDGEVWRSSEAVRRVCFAAGGAGWLLWAILTIIPKPVREFGYRLVAANRTRLFTNGSCGFPEEGMREKMRA
ncbi:MAG: DUF393 domain-containing protein [Akkermansiaceae bacterium]|jgi:predicted DCC family thiol-disulfide oxidoreductase YuxK